MAPQFALSSKLWFLHDLEEVIEQNKEKFDTGKNSWYNLLLMSVHIFIAGKFLDREGYFQEMKAIHDEDKPISNHIGFVLPSKNPQEGTLEFGLLKEGSVKKMRPISEKNQKNNEELAVLQNFLMFIYSINPKEEIFQEQFFSQLEAMFGKWWEDQIIKQVGKEKTKKEIKEPTKPDDKH